MRSMLYVGAALMIGASLYGFVDYKRSSHKKEFTGMYKDPGKKAVPGTDVVKTGVGSAEKREEAVEKKINSGSPAVQEVKKENFFTKAIKKKRRIRSEFFSRAPIRESDLELVPVDEKTKEKIEKKKD